MECVLVHGWMVTAKLWDGFAPRLGVPALAPSLIPAGTEIATTTLDDLAARVLDEAARAGFLRFHLVGHSMGGQVAKLVAARAPGRVASLALVNPVPLGGLPLPPDVATAFRSSGEDRAAQSAILKAACLELSTDAKESLLDDAGSVPKAWVARALDLFVAGGDQKRLDEIVCPTLVVATDDPFLPPSLLEEATVSRIRDARMVVIRGPGHYPQLERADELASVLCAFFTEVSQTTEKAS